jgi:hypothetical protein
MKITDLVVSPTGVGWKDYDITVNRSVNPLASATKHQARTLGAATYAGLPSLTYPDVYWAQILLYNTKNEQVFVIPSDHDEWIFSASVGGDTNATTALALAVADDYSDTFDPVGTIQILALKFAPHVAEFQFQQGLYFAQFAGKPLFLGFAHYSLNPVATLHISVAMLRDLFNVSVVRGASGVI